MSERKRKPRRLKAPQPCRYCGHVCETHAREATKGGAFVAYSCRDAKACGERIRAKTNWKITDDGIPF